MQSDFQVKAPETEEDFLKYYEFRYNLLRKPWNQPKGSEKDELEDKSIHRMVVDKDNNVIAVGRLHFNSEKEAQIRYMAVDEAHRRLGLGSKVVADLEKVAKERGAEEIVLIAREGALDFYTGNGYKIIKDSHTLFGEVKHKEMRKSLITA